MATATATFSAAVQLYEAGRLAEAEAICRDLLLEGLPQGKVLRLLGVIARKRGGLADSRAALEQGLSLEPRNPLLWFELATTEMSAGARDSAMEKYRRAIQLDPNFQEAYLNIGGILEQEQRFDDALPWTTKAVQLRPDCPLAHYNLGTVYRGLGKIHEAIVECRRAIELKPDYARAHWNLANHYLLIGDFERGWPEYEWRERAEEVFLDRYAHPRWNGENLTGKTLLVHAEQGVGDEILFASCYRELIERSGRCILVCDPRLQALFRRSFPGSTVFGYQRRKDWAPLAIAEHIDYQIAAGSVPLHLRRRLDDFPTPLPFLKCDSACLSSWKKRLAQLGPGLKVGISWRAGGKPAERRKRTTLIEQWAGLFAVEGVCWVNVQYGDATDEIAAAHAELGVLIHDWADADPLVDLDAFAAKLSALDLVISVGNATVHMAGALGVPAWTLLPRVPAWRWMFEGENSPWYGGVRLFRQSKAGEWAPVFEKLRSDLIEAAARRQSFNQSSPSAQLAETTEPSAQFIWSPPLAPPSPATPADRFSLSDAGILDEHSIPHAVEKAVRHHQAGELETAESIYRQVLHHAPRYQDALHLLGVLARQTGRAELAIQSIGRAIAVGGAAPVIHFNMGNALQDAGKIEEAAESYRRAIELHEDFPQAHLNLGILLQKLGKHQEAIAELRKVQRLDPGCAESLLHLGHSLQQTCRPDEAVQCFENAIRLRPDFAEAHSRLGTALWEDGRLDEAIGFAARAVALKPGSASAYHNLGTIQRALGKSEAALESFRKSLALLPNSAPTWANMADLLHQEGDLDGAATAYKSAIEHDAGCADTLNNYGMVLQEQGDLERALEYYERAVALDAQSGLAHSNRALAWLQMGNFAQGWDEYEWRWRCQNGLRPRNYFRQPLWDGSSLEGKTILVHGEQGLGDEIMFATCLPDVIRSAKHCVMTCDRRLARLFTRSFPRATVHGIARGHEHRWPLPAEPRIDVQIPAGSLPRYLRRSEASFPRQASLLAANPALADRWRARVAALGPGLKIGVSWRAGKKPSDRRQRWTELAQWKQIVSLPSAHFVSLQYGDCREEIDDFQRTTGLTIHCWSDCNHQGDLDDLAALIGALDMVVSVGNANIHLAGAMGTIAWSLLPHGGGWRWLQERDFSLWYESVRLFRQVKTGDWGEVFRRIQAELLKVLASRVDES